VPGSRLARRGRRRGEGEEEGEGASLLLLTWRGEEGPGKEIGKKGRKILPFSFHLVRKNSRRKKRGGGISTSNQGRTGS